MERAEPYKTTSRVTPELQLREAIKEILAEMLGLNTAPVSVRQWYDTNSAYLCLGLDSPEQLRIMVREDTLRIGHEVRDIRQRNSQVPRYQFHVAKCEARLCELPERRSATRRSRPKKAA